MWNFPKMFPLVIFHENRWQESCDLIKPTVFQIQTFEKTDKKTFMLDWEMIGLAVLSYSMDENNNVGVRWDFSIEIHSNALNKFALRDEPKKNKIAQNLPIHLNTEKSHRTSSLFLLQKKTKRSDKSFTIDFYVNVFLSVLIRFFKLKNRWCDEFTWLRSTIFMKNHRGEWFGKVSHPYTE